MKVVVVITEADALKEFERECISNPERGFTIIPEVWGRGKTGLKTGTRAHPGGSGLLFTIVPDSDLESATASLKAVRDRIGVTETTKIYVATADEVS